MLSPRMVKEFMNDLTTGGVITVRAPAPEWIPFDQAEAMDDLGRLSSFLKTAMVTHYRVGEGVWHLTRECANARSRRRYRWESTNDVSLPRMQEVTCKRCMKETDADTLNVVRWSRLASVSGVLFSARSALPSSTGREVSSKRVAEAIEQVRSIRALLPDDQVMNARLSVALDEVAADLAAVPVSEKFALEQRAAGIAAVLFSACARDFKMVGAPDVPAFGGYIAASADVTQSVIERLATWGNRAQDELDVAALFDTAFALQMRRGPLEWNQIPLTLVERAPDMSVAEWLLASWQDEFNRAAQAFREYASDVVSTAEVGPNPMVDVSYSGSDLHGGKSAYAFSRISAAFPSTSSPDGKVTTYRVPGQVAGLFLKQAMLQDTTAPKVVAAHRADAPLVKMALSLLDSNPASHMSSFTNALAAAADIGA